MTAPDTARLRELAEAVPDIKRLRELAQAAEAAAPSPWEAVSNSWEISTVYREAHSVCVVSIDPLADEDTQARCEAEKDAAAEFIAAANPATVTALCDRVERLEEALRLALKALDAIGDEMTVGERYTNAGQYLIDALPAAREALK